MIENAIYSFCEYFGPYEKTRKYRGFILAYTRGYSLVGRIRGNKVYEPDLSRKIIDELRRSKSSYFLDVGANIGLISLNALSELPDLNVFCFEPGPQQASLLKRTIQLNNIDGKMKLFQYALGEKKGDASFATHCSVHTSADGFFDTGRAGKSRPINVPVDTLDNWWKFAGSCLIKVIKVDTEGAELWVLAGGNEFIKQCRPVIFLEINKNNLKPYPYSGLDLLKWFTCIWYNLKTLDGELVTENNLNHFLEQGDSFVARPNEDEK